LEFYKLDYQLKSLKHVYDYKKKVEKERKETLYKTTLPRIVGTINASKRWVFENQPLCIPNYYYPKGDKVN
jgi:hypothetical protein